MIAPHALVVVPVMAPGKPGAAAGPPSPLRTSRSGSPPAEELATAAEIPQRVQIAIHISPHKVKEEDRGMVIVGGALALGVRTGQAVKIDDDGDIVDEELALEEDVASHSHSGAPRLLTAVLPVHTALPAAVSAGVAAGAAAAWNGIMHVQCMSTCA